MAIIKNNVENVKFLRNQNPFESREAARTALENNKGIAEDGTSLLARYTVSGEVKTIVGYVAVVGETHHLTIIDVEGGSEDVEALRKEINAKLGNGIGSGASETVTAQLTALSGNGSSTSAETSVEGAKRYADELKSQMDYTGVTTGTGVYVTNVTQSDGIVSATTATLPTVTGEVESKKVVMSVSEDKGEIAVTKGTIESSDKTVVISDLVEGNGVDFKVNIDGETLVADTDTGVISVASAALTQYVGDEDTIHISAADAQNNKTVSSLLTIQKVTTGLSEIVKEEYRLIGASGNTIGAPVQIYKDSHIVSITYITEGEHAQNLEYVYIDASGNTQTTYVDMSELVLETEFASGVTVTDGIAHGVVDQTSESFLTVGADGFKLAGVQDAINTAVSGLDADVSGTTEHIKVNVVEADGVITTVNVEEDNIANADDLAALSAKTITDVKSANGSVTVTPGNVADGTKEIDLATDADKIQMSGFSADSASALSGIATSDSIATAFEKTNAVITENERVTAEALNDLDTRLDKVEDEYISGITVNGSGVTVTDNVAALTLSSAPSTGAAETPIIVETSNNGGITLKFDGLDCGYYA